MSEETPRIHASDRIIDMRSLNRRERTADEPPSIAELQRIERFAKGSLVDSHLLLAAAPVLLEITVAALAMYPVPGESGGVDFDTAKRALLASLAKVTP